MPKHIETVQAVYQRTEDDCRIIVFSGESPSSIAAGAYDAMVAFMAMGRDADDPFTTFDAAEAILDNELRSLYELSKKMETVQRV